MTFTFKYYFGLACLFLFFSAITFLFAHRFFIEKGKVFVSVNYHAFQNEDISLYWNDGHGFSDQNHQTLKTEIGNHTYEFQLNALDSLTEIRIDPDSDFDISILHHISVLGLSEPIRFSANRPSRLNGVLAFHTEDQTVLQRKKPNTDPYIVLSIPPKAKLISNKYTLRDIYILCLCIITSFLFFLFMKGRIKSSLVSFELPKIGLISVFLISTSIYWTNECLHFYTRPLSIENRSLARKPNMDSLLLEPKKYFSAYSDWFVDHFAFKQCLVYMNSNLKIHVFKTSPMPESMYIGKNFEFFSANSLLTDDVTGKRRLSAEEIQSLFANILYKQKHLFDQNISYYLTIPPSKQTVYADLLPDYLGLQKKCCKMAEQFADEIKSKKANFYIDVISILKEQHNKFPNERVFYQYDLHWSDWGAFLAYRKLIDRIYQDHPWVGQPLTKNEIEIDTLFTEDADLSKLILMNKVFKKEKYLIQAKADTITETVVNGVYQFPIYKYKNTKAKGKVLFFRDSYSEQWKWMIARHFNESVFIWDQNMSQKVIDEYKPDIVIQENCEMFLFYLFKPFKPNE